MGPDYLPEYRIQNMGYPRKAFGATLTGLGAVAAILFAGQVLIPFHSLLKWGIAFPPHVTLGLAIVGILLCTLGQHVSGDKETGSGRRGISEHAPKKVPKASAVSYAALMAFAQNAGLENIDDGMTMDELVAAVCGYEFNASECIPEEVAMLRAIGATVHEA